jgi:hypothetical protein
MVNDKLSEEVSELLPKNTNIREDEKYKYFGFTEKEKFP